MGFLSPYVIIGLMIAVSTIFIFLNIRRLEKHTALLTEDISSIRSLLLQQVAGSCRPVQVPVPQVNRNEVVANDEDTMTEDLQKEIAEYERQIRELNELKGEENPQQEIMSGLANIMAGIPQMGNWGGMGITVIHSADIPEPIVERDKITEIPEGEVEVEDEVSQTPSETPSVVGTGTTLSQEARLIYERYTISQLKDMCKKHGLPMKGNKNELSSRLSSIPEVVEGSRRNTLVMKLA